MLFEVFRHGSCLPSDRGVGAGAGCSSPEGFSFSPVRLWSAVLCCLSPSVPLEQVHQGGKRPYIGGMPHLDLTDEEAAALVQHLKRAIDGDRYPLSPRLAPVKAILAKLRPEPVGEPLPPPKVYAPPRATAGRRRHAGRSRSA